MASEARFAVTVARTAEAREAVFALADGASERLTPFQSSDWLKAWYASFCSAAQMPYITLVHEAHPRAGRPDHERVAFALPLIRRWRYGLPMVEFADRGVTDYNLPIPGPAMPRDARSLEAAFAAVSAALRPHVRLALRKMPLVRADGTAFPVPPDLAPATSGGECSPLSAYVCDLGASPDAFAARLGSKKAKDLRRRTRVLAGLGHEPAFRFAASAAERRAVLDLIARSQRSRYGDEAGYLLDRPRYEAFYRTLACGNAACGGSGFARLAALWMGERPVAGLLALVRSGQCVVVRLGMVEDDEIARAGPGKLLLHAMGLWAAGEGLATLDLSLGHNDLKAWFRCRPIGLGERVTYANGYVVRGGTSTGGTANVAVAPTASRWGRLVGGGQELRRR